VLGRYPVWRVRIWQVLDPGIKTEPEPGLIFGSGFHFFKELEPKLELGS
jgi:hypothetical protein